MDVLRGEVESSGRRAREPRRRALCAGHGGGSKAFAPAFLFSVLRDLVHGAPFAMGKKCFSYQMSRLARVVLTCPKDQDKFSPKRDVCTCAGGHGGAAPVCQGEPGALKGSRANLGQAGRTEAPGASSPCPALLLWGRFYPCVSDARSEHSASDVWRRRRHRKQDLGFSCYNQRPSFWRCRR